MEIVTEPDIRTAEQARRYAEELQLLLRSIGASDADMERGQMRVEANVSLRPRGTEPFGTRVEVKNMNSFRAVERAIDVRDRAPGGRCSTPASRSLQETRGWSEERGETYRMRVKETSDDYRYFPEPDLPPLHLDAAWLAEIAAGLPELPARTPRALSGCARADRLRRRRCSSPTPTRRRCSRRPAPPHPSLEAKPVANWVTGEYLRLRNATDGPVVVAARGARGDRRARSPPERSRGPRRARSSRRTPRPARARPRSSPSAASARSRTAATLTAAVDAAIAANPAAVADYRAGKAQAVGFLVGQVMKATRGQANAALVQAAVRERLDAEREGEG